MNSIIGNQLVVLGKNWVVCLLVATGITAVSFCSVQIAVVVMHMVNLLLGLPGTDGPALFSI